MGCMKTIEQTLLFDIDKGFEVYENDLRAVSKIYSKGVSLSCFNKMTIRFEKNDGLEDGNRNWIKIEVVGSTGESASILSMDSIKVHIGKDLIGIDSIEIVRCINE